MLQGVRTILVTVWNHLSGLSWISLKKAAMSAAEIAKRLGLTEITPEAVASTDATRHPPILPRLRPGSPAGVGTLSYGMALQFQAWQGLLLDMPFPVKYPPHFVRGDHGEHGPPWSRRPPRHIPALAIAQILQLIINTPSWGKGRVRLPSSLPP